MARSISALVKKYGASVFFPVAAFSSIYLDYSHTQKWKKEKELAIATAKLELS